jgi:hypothetical protein
MASPLGKALLGGKVGQKVDITLPMGKRKLKIVSLIRCTISRALTKTFHDVTDPE